MKRSLLTLAITLFAALTGYAQQPVAAQEMIGITPIVSDAIDLPADARSALNLKLRQMATQNGFGSTSGRFALTSNVVFTDKQATTTAPPQFVVSLEVQFYVVDVMEQVIIDEMSMPAKGIDRLENKAAIRAINSISVRTPQVRRFMNGARDKIVAYYNTRVPVIVQKADSYAAMENYDMALFVLTDIPESVDQYPMVLERMVDIYNKKIDGQVASALNKARAQVALGENEKAVAELMQLNSYGSHAADVNALIAEIKGDITDKQQQELEARMAEPTPEIIKMSAEPIISNDLFMDSLNKWFGSKF